MKKQYRYLVAGVLMILLNTSTLARNNQDAQNVPDVPKDQAARQAQYEATRNQILPLLPEQIMDYQGQYNVTRQAEGLPTPKGRSRIVDIELDILSSPIPVQVTPGMTSSIVVVDVTGKPWPITSVSNGGPKQFQIIQPEGYGLGNLVTASPMIMAGRTNLQLTIDGESIPVTFQIVTDLHHYDDRVMIRIQKRGPRAVLPMIGEGVDPTASAPLMRVVDGLPPTPDARSIKVDGLLAWITEKDLYVRVPDNEALYSPYTQVQTGINGYRAYRLPRIESLMISRNGQMQFVAINEQSTLGGLK